jgi:hypothetical protein
MTYTINNCQTKYNIFKNNNNCQIYGIYDSTTSKISSMKIYIILFTLISLIINKILLFNYKLNNNIYKHNYIQINVISFYIT